MTLKPVANIEYKGLNKTSRAEHKTEKTQKQLNGTPMFQKRNYKNLKTRLMTYLTKNRHELKIYAQSGRIYSTPPDDKGKIELHLNIFTSWA
ncbi:MAG: hypothetical protein U9R19_04695 [Bacteroidota bacterium]|nr:hypothetical protein [Bacteroidota bacterium]